MATQATAFQSGFPEQGRCQSIQRKSSNLFVLPLTQGDDNLVKPEIMVGIWNQIIAENKYHDLFYDGTVKDLREWLEYIYNKNNHVSLVLDNAGHIYHIAWINKFSNGHGFLHHCSLGNYNRGTWPTLKAYFQGMMFNDQPVIKTLMGVTPESNTKAVRLLKIIGWTILGTIPGICYLANENKHVGGVVSFAVINEV